MELPNPATVQEMYLAAILDEIKGMRKDMKSLGVKDEESPMTLEDLVHVKEPSAKKRR